MIRRLEADRSWPASHFYWAVLDGSIFPGRRRPTSDQLGYLFEPLVPQPFEELHAVYHPLGNRRYLACAAPSQALQELSDNALSLTPESLPAFVSEAVDPAGINLLSGPHTPPRIRREAARRWRLATALILLCTLVLVAGLERRVRSADDRRVASEAAIAGVYADVLAGVPAPPGLPLSALMQAEWRTLKATRSGTSNVADERDAAVTLSLLLDRWPENLELQPESVHVNPNSIHIRGQVSDTREVMRLQDALEDFDGWRLATPSVRRSGTGWNVNLSLSRVAEEGSMQ